MNDLISDYIIRLKNASLSNNSEVISPHSKLQESLAKLMVDQGLLDTYKVDIISGHKNIITKLKQDGVRTVRLDATRISKPGRRVYTRTTQMTKYILGQGTVIISTPLGLMTAKQAIKAKQGGELICKITLK